MILFDVEQLLGSEKLSEEEIFKRAIHNAEEKYAEGKIDLADKDASSAGFICYLVGADYCLGKGTQKDNEKALYWLKRAVENGENSAYFYLGLCYLSCGTEQDRKHAVKCFYIAAGAAHRASGGLMIGPACYQLGKCYENGIGVPMDRHLAAKFYKRALRSDECSEESVGLARDAVTRFSERELGADEILINMAEAGNVEAAYRLGQWFEAGNNLFHAERWYWKAAEQDHSGAQYHLACLYMERDEVATAIERKRAIELFQKSAEQGNADAQVALGTGYAGICDLHRTSYPVGLETDMSEAAKWFHRAAVQGHPHGKYFYGCLCLDGNGTEKKVTEGIRWLIEAGQARKEGNFQCLRPPILRLAIASALMSATRGGKLREADRQTIFSWLCRTAEEDAFADYHACIGECCYHGYGTERNGTRAIAHLQRAVSDSSGLTFYHPADAMKLLAVCYEKGFGVERNLHEAFRWYGRAAASGDPESAEKVASCYESGISVESDSQKAAIFRD